MKRKYITAEILYDTEETWEVTLKEIQEIMEMLTTLRRKAKIIDIEQGVNTDE